MIDRILPRMYCIDPAKLKIQGSKYSFNFDRLSIDIIINENRCRQGNIYDSECVTRKGFDEMLGSKSLVFLWNKIRFESNDYDENSYLVKESELTWYNIPRFGQTINIVAKKVKLSLYDNLLMHLSNISE